MSLGSVNYLKNLRNKIQEELNIPEHKDLFEKQNELEEKEEFIEKKLEEIKNKEELIKNKLEEIKNKEQELMLKELEINKYGKELKLFESNLINFNKSISKNDLLPKVAEKKKYYEFMLGVFNNRLVENKSRDEFDKMIANEDEYIVHESNYGSNQLIITNYGKIFFKHMYYRAGFYANFHVNNMNEMILNDIKIKTQQQIGMMYGINSCPLFLGGMLFN